MLEKWVDIHLSPLEILLMDYIDLYNGKDTFR